MMQSLLWFMISEVLAGRAWLSRAAHGAGSEQPGEGGQGGREDKEGGRGDRKKGGGREKEERGIDR